MKGQKRIMFMERGKQLLFPLFNAYMKRWWTWRPLHQWSGHSVCQVWPDNQGKPTSLGDWKEKEKKRDRKGRMGKGVWKLTRIIFPMSTDHFRSSFCFAPFTFPTMSPSEIGIFNGKRRGRESKNLGSVAWRIFNFWGLLDTSLGGFDYRWLVTGEQVLVCFFSI